MINNTGDLIRVLKIWAGGITLLTAGFVGFAISRGIRSLKKYSRPFDPENLQEATGIILEVFRAKESSYDTRGIILLLDVEDEILEVHVGPTWYVEHQVRSFRTGEEVAVIGSMVSYRGEDILVVQQLEKGKKQYRFRDDEGSPYWESRIA